MSYGFGHGGFGSTSFGAADWARIVLWDELPSNIRADDEAAGGAFREFVTALMPSFRWLTDHIERFRSVIEFDQARPELLRYVADAFGIRLDLEQPVDFQRLRLSLLARWNVIKGTEEAIRAVGKCYGFDVDVYRVFAGCDGTEVSEPVNVGAEKSDYSVSGSGPYDMLIEFGNTDLEPGTVSIQVGSTFYQDDGQGGFVGANGVVEYGAGVAKLEGLAATAQPYSSYNCEPGHCCSCLTDQVLVVAYPSDELVESEQLNAEDAYRRMLQAMESDTVSAYARLVGLLYDGADTLDLAYLYDTTGDGVAVDSGLRVVP